MSRHCTIMSLILLMFWLPAIGTAPSFAGLAAPSDEESNSLVSAFKAYTDLRIRSVQQSLEILSATSEARSGNWSNVKGLLKGYQESDEGFIVWYLRPDGSYYTADKGLMECRFFLTASPSRSMSL